MTFIKVTYASSTATGIAPHIEFMKEKRLWSKTQSCLWLRNEKCLRKNPSLALLACHIASPCCIVSHCWPIASPCVRSFEPFLADQMTLPGPSIHSRGRFLFVPLCVLRRPRFGLKSDICEIGQSWRETGWRKKIHTDSLRSWFEAYLQCDVSYPGLLI